MGGWWVLGGKPCYEVVSARHQDVLLAEHVLLLLGLHDVLLLETLQSVRHAGLLTALDQLHTAKPAHPERGHHLQIVQLNVQLLLRDLALAQQLLDAGVLPVLHDVPVLLVPQLGEVAHQLEEGSRMWSLVRELAGWLLLSVQGETLCCLAGGHHAGCPGVGCQKRL